MSKLRLLFLALVATFLIITGAGCAALREPNPYADAWFSIADAHATGAISLSLAGLGLEKLPSEIGQLTKLTELDLVANFLTELPSEIGQLSNLRILKLGGSDLTQLPSEIGNLSSLEQLEICCNELDDLPSEIGKLSNLRSLDLHGNRLTSLLPEIAQLRNLEVLYLTSNQLEQLTPQIGQLQNLRILGLHGNQLTTLPPEIGNLANLEELRLSYNQLTTLPPEIGQLTNLRLLHIDGNPLEGLPLEIGQLSNLEELSLGGLGLTSLPPELGQLKNLRILRMSSAALVTRHLPAVVGQLTGLEELYLEYTGLTSLPPEIGHLTNLRVLVLTSNQLTSLPPEIGELRNLKTLNLAYNPLVILPSSIGNLVSLEEMNLERTMLTSLPAEIGQLTNLRKLDVQVAQLTTLPPEIGQLKYLETLSACCNALERLPAEIGQLTNLQTIYLYSNALTSLPPEIGDLFRVEKLHLSSNQLESVPSEIGRLLRLKELDLSHNALTDLPTEIGQLSNLCVLDLRHNQLLHLPNSLGWLWRLGSSEEKCGYVRSQFNLEENPLVYPSEEILARDTSGILLYLREQSLTATPPPFATSTPEPTLTPSTTPTPALTYILSPTPTLIPTIGPSATRTPTATAYPALATAIAKGECIQSFQSFAYDGPGMRGSEQKLPLLPWQLVAAIPSHQLEGYNELFMPNVVISRMTESGLEIWVRGVIYAEGIIAPSKTLFAIYKPDSQRWDWVSGDVGTTGLAAEEIFVDSEGTVWGRTTWKSGQEYPDFDHYPVLSRFNETTRHFEPAEGVLELPLIREKVIDGATYYLLDETRIVLGNDNGFWIVAQNDGLYHYDPDTQITVKRLDLTDQSFVSPALSPDESIYFAQAVDRTNATTTRDYFALRDGMVGQFIPETGEILSVDTPDEGWPSSSGLLVDRTGRLWLGSVGYRAPDGQWHLVHPYPKVWFDVIESGSYSYVWAMPHPMLESSDGRIWFQKFMDTGGWGEGTAWYDPATNEGCLFTNQPANIIEDAHQQLWMVAAGNLYKYQLNP